MRGPRLVRGTVAMLVGCLLLYGGDRLLGVQIELFHGLATFSIWWIMDVFVLPFLVGAVVAYIYGLGGKWLCYFPPLIVRGFSYYQVAALTGIPEGSSLLPLGWWGFFVILVVEAAAFGGALGERLWIKLEYADEARALVESQKANSPKGGSNI